MAQPQSSPSTSTQASSAPGGQTPSKSNNADAHSSPAFSLQTLDWEGDKLLHIYMMDYCRKRNFTKTVQSLSSEADLAIETSAPINAPQGLLFE
ncbi:hypothetical protein BS47DRAFT_1042818 [Hydnum rufescens UP504]|uniref:LisH domain-containing protein n=1 Tax=Hydnum rufescens UP504 TaxID=1448309 RepID=A0A9P6AVJ0_9AGAM|nr:hypothetical protein BS47DRAFT_1042818 [Hydnum rufescens UP504]